jgi:hypothetical protein
MPSLYECCNGQFISSQDASIEKKAYATLIIEQKQQICQKKIQSSKEFLLIKVKEDALKKSLIFLEQQDSIDFKTKDLTAARRLINQITLQRMSLLLMMMDL